MLQRLGQSGKRQVVLQKFDRMDQTRTGSVPLWKFFETLEQSGVMEIPRKEQHSVQALYGTKDGCRIRYRDMLAQI